MDALKYRVIAGADRLRLRMLVAVVIGSTLAFGGAVWWAGPVLGLAIAVLAMAGLVRAGLSGRIRVVASPLPILGLLAVGLAAFQLAPMPAGLLATIAPRSAALHDEVSGGVGTGTISLDRPATLRWLVGAAGCLAVYMAASHLADRAARLRLVVGAVVIAFGACTAIGLVQALAGPGAGTPYGMHPIGHGPWWWPSLLDARHAPGTAVFRVAPGLGGSGGIAFARPVPSDSVGPLLGGTGAYLALASVGLPLAIGLALQAIAPRGSRERLELRLASQGGASRPILLASTAILGAGMVGFLVEWPFAVPVAVGIVMAGLGASWGAGVRLPAAALTASSVGAIALGLTMGTAFGRPVGSPSFAEAKAGWLDGARVVREHPIWGAGFGSYPTVAPLTKTVEETPGTAGSSLIQWGAEAGLAGLALVGLGAVWFVVRVPRAIARVGSADRPMAAGLLGSAVGFGLASTVGWTVQLPAVALAASAMIGVLDRWLAGGSDLFVEATS